MDVGGFTVTVAVPDFVLSCTDFAAIVTLVTDVTDGAVNNPVADIVPAVADHVTALE